MKKLLHIGLIAMGLWTATQANAAITFNFDTDANGFTAEGADLTYVATGGNPGGFLQIADASSTDNQVFLPVSLLGNWSSYLGGTLSFAVKNINGESPDYFASTDIGHVILQNGATSVVFDLVPNGQPAVGAGWQTFSATLDAAHWGSALPSVLSNVTFVSLSFESHNGVSEVNGFDNFAVAAAVPEPESWALLLAGLGVVGWAQRRRAATLK